MAAPSITIPARTALSEQLIERINSGLGYRRLIIAASHGILTGTTDPSWNCDLRTFIDTRLPEAISSRIRVLAPRYWAFPLPRLNYYLKNPIHARYLAGELLCYLEAGWQCAFVGHSNGTHVNWLAQKTLSNAGYTTRAHILIGSVLDEDVERSGVLEAVQSGKLGRAVCYASRTDYALRARLIDRPYGDLGLRGFTLDGYPYELELENRRVIYTRLFDGGHSGYFAGSQREQTFIKILEDLFP
jgi:hypothetical protein